MLVEGDDNDAFLMERAFHAAGVKTKVVRIADGEEAIDRLRGNGNTPHVPEMRPDLIILAIRLPKIDGLEVLKWVRGQSEYTRRLLSSAQGLWMRMIERRRSSAGRTIIELNRRIIWVWWKWHGILVKPG